MRTKCLPAALAAVIVMLVGSSAQAAQPIHVPGSNAVSSEILDMDKSTNIAKPEGFFSAGGSSAGVVDEEKSCERALNVARCGRDRASKSR